MDDFATQVQISNYTGDLPLDRQANSWGEFLFRLQMNDIGRKSAVSMFFKIFKVILFCITNFFKSFFFLSTSLFLQAKDGLSLCTLLQFTWFFCTLLKNGCKGGLHLICVCRLLFGALH